MSITNMTTLVKNVKKVIRWGKGLSVFITKEARILGWDDKTHVIISVIEDEEGRKIVIRELPIK